MADSAATAASARESDHSTTVRQEFARQAPTFAQDDSFFIAMEFIHGEDIRRVWKHADKIGKPIPLALICRMIIDASAGLDYAHKKTDEFGEEQHRSQEFVVLDRVGRLQLPQEYVRTLGLEGLVRLELADDHAQVHPTETGKAGDK